LIFIMLSDAKKLALVYFSGPEIYFTKFFKEAIWH